MNIQEFAMRKILILTLIFISSFSLFSEEKYDFRKARWDMSFNEVLKSEDTKPVFSFKDSCIKYSDMVYFKNVEIFYHFTEGKLSRATISFINLFPLEKNNYYEEYATIRSYYIKKYGKVSSNRTDWYNKTFKNKPDKINEAIAKKHVSITDSWELKNTIVSIGVFANDSGEVSILALYKKKIKSTITEEEYLSEKI